jgi:hypothetical protein
MERQSETSDADLGIRNIGTESLLPLPHVIKAQPLFREAKRRKKQGEVGIKPGESYFERRCTSTYHPLLAPSNLLNNVGSIMHVLLYPLRPCVSVPSSVESPFRSCKQWSARRSWHSAPISFVPLSHDTEACFRLSTTACMYH